ncbi:MAG: ABC transporter ATP-binding protein [Chloroflexota bacterium]|nr:ABC transporter ATP-binding protein [Chloroflexota bacterium]
MSDPLVQVAQLVKRYDGRAVVDGLDLTVHAGEIVALLGPNGAGKTTTVEIIEGYRSPDGGAVRVFGVDPRRDGALVKPRLGLMLQSGELYSQVKVLEAIELFAAFYPRPLDPRRLLEQLGLEPLATKRYRRLSGGERQRLNLGIALVGRPELAILDEPTAALDAAARQRTWQLLRELREQGTAVLLTTHLLEEAEELCDRILIIDAGRLVADGTPAELRRLGGPGPDGLREVRLQLAEPLGPERLESLGRLASVREVRVERSKGYLLATASPSMLLLELGGWLCAEGLEPLSIRLGEPSLEETFLRLTGQGERR